MRRNAETISRAAFLRAAGWTWPQIAEELNRSEKTLSDYPAKYPDEWESAIVKAESEVRTDLLHKAYGRLEEMLLSGEPALIESAVRMILQHGDRRHAINTKRRVELSGKIDHKHSTYLDMVCDRLGIDPPVRSN